MSEDVGATTTALTVVEALPGTPARVMNAGTALSREVAQELAAVVERTFRRERLRRTTSARTVIGGVVGAILCAFGGLVLFGRSAEELAVVMSVMIAAPLALHLLWGARNRALLDVAADDGAMPRAVLVDAVQRMRRAGVGPSTALRDAQAALRWP